ncbi:glycosyltransferase [Microseira wollei]|uniref:Glycosyl transferase, group 1 family protein n=1 Tax=Microseira wollei NIES-4236 TaxID=2530354 RepID=A0AAV3XFN5_9CYAN|nr:glycosyltransferase family 4 protein [Microseira wollei]GET41762.1 glycosyl transferase, group 1 family protein [Microseira wollei NIES-4236]
MNVIVMLEHRFVQTPDGAVWTQTMFAYSFWQRYLEVFDTVKVVARILAVASPPPDWKRADGEGVSSIAVPYYIGPQQYLLQAFSVKRAVRNAVALNDALILRVSSQLAGDVQPFLQRTRRPYGVEVVADPYDVFAPGSVKHPLRPFFRWWFPRQLRRICAGATAAAYVTESALQQRYPPGCNSFSTHCSDVELPDSAFVSLPRTPRQASGLLTLICVGTMDQLYKAPDLLIDAVATCVREGLNLKLVLVGDGKHRPELEARAAKLNLAERVCFLGWLPAGDAVRAQLDLADLFVLPSHQEGLPRAMVEAMARALPCIGSTVGGIPELLSGEDLVPPGDVAALAGKIRQVVTNPERMASMSARNLDKARGYTDRVLHQRRIEFYRYVREQTEAWLKTHRTDPRRVKNPVSASSSRV